AVRPVHYSALGKAESLLIKTDGGLHIGDCEHRGHGTVLFLVEWINLLRHVSPLGSGYFSKAFRMAAGLDNSSRKTRILARGYHGYIALVAIWPENENGCWRD